MSVKNVVKVMNFHALLRVNGARRKVEQAHEYEHELRSVISSVVNNRIFKAEGISLTLDPSAKELNIYIGSDYGFCANFNADVMSYIDDDKPENDKIIIGKRILTPNTKNVLMYVDKEDFSKKEEDIYKTVLDGIIAKKYSKINIIYIHYYSLSKQEIVKRTILPFDYASKNDDSIKLSNHEDYVVEGDLNRIIWNLISTYVAAEINIAEAWSWASENVQREMFTDNSIKKIEEKEESKKMQEKKRKHHNAFKMIIEMNNRKVKLGEE